MYRSAIEQYEEIFGVAKKLWPKNYLFSTILQLNGKYLMAVIFGKEDGIYSQEMALETVVGPLHRPKILLT